MQTDDKITINKVVDLNPAVTEHQGIDLGGIENMLRDTEGRPAAKVASSLDYFKPQILELIEHVRNDGLLERVSQARLDMVKDVEQAFSSQY